MKTKLKFALLAAVFVPSLAYTHNVTFGTPAVGGNGCAGAIVRWEQSPRGNTLLIIEGRSGVVAKKALSRMSCMLAVPVSMRLGDQLLVKSFSMVSDLVVPKGSKGTMSAEVFVGASEGQKLTKKIKGGKQTAAPLILAKDLLTVTDIDTNLRVNVASMLQNTSKKEAGQNGIQSLILELEAK